MDENNRSRHERRSLRWVALTRESIPLGGRNKGKTSVERTIYICSIEPDLARGGELLERICHYRDIKGGLHQRLDVSGARRERAVVPGNESRPVRDAEMMGIECTRALHETTRPKPFGPRFQELAGSNRLSGFW